MKPVAPARIAAALGALWSPRIIAEVDDAYVKVARVHGEFGWHAHQDEDELFFILAGELRIELESGPVRLAAGELYVVPKGVRHNPVAEHECHLLLVERKTTRHSGEEITEKTRSIAEQLGQT